MPHSSVTSNTPTAHTSDLQSNPCLEDHLFIMRRDFMSPPAQPFRSLQFHQTVPSLQMTGKCRSSGEAFPKSGNLSYKMLVHMLMLRQKHTRTFPALQLKCKKASIEWLETQDMDMNRRKIWWAYFLPSYRASFPPKVLCSSSGLCNKLSLLILAKISLWSGERPRLSLLKCMREGWFGTHLCPLNGTDSEIASKEKMSLYNVLGVC